MAILNQKRILNLIPKISAPVTLHVSQGDVGTEIQFTLVKGDELFVNPGNVSASVHGVREDGANFGAFTCTLSGSTVSFPLHAEMTAVKGSALAEIVIVDNYGNKVGSANFAILVEESVFPLGVTYDNDVSVYESILAYVQTIPAQVTEDYNTKINAEIAARQAADTSLNEALANETNARISAISSEAEARINADASLQTQIDEIIAPSGEAPSAAEVENARIGADNVTYPTLGDAIRSQVENLQDEVENLKNNTLEEKSFKIATKLTPNFEVLEGYYTSDAGNLVSNVDYDTYVFKTDRATDIWFEHAPALSTYTSVVGYSTNQYDSSHRLFTRLRYQYGGENTLPNSNNKVSFEENQYIAVSIPKAQDFNLLGFIYSLFLNDELYLNENQLQQVNNRNSYVQYETETTYESSNEQLSIFIPSGSNHYIKYRIVHTVFSARNADCWRLGIADVLDSDFNYLFNATTAAEWECAVKINGRSDFSGGYAHGDEIGTAFLIFVDGKKVSTNELFNKTIFNELRVVTYSTLYDPIDGVTAIAYHGCERIFKNGVLTVNQTINWLQNETLDACYLCMLGCAKISEGIIVTSNYYTDASFEPIAIPDPVARTITDVKETNLYAQNGIFASVKINDYPEDIAYNGNGDIIISDNNGQNYNKLYYIVCNSGSVNSGDRWKSSANYIIQKN